MVKKILEATMTFSHFFITTIQDESYTMMSHPNLVDFVISVFQREEIAKLCTEDFFNSIELNPNKEQADGESTESEDDPRGIETRNKTE